MILREIIDTFEDDPLELVGLTDYELFSRLTEDGSPLFTRYRERKLPKRCQYFTVKSGGDKGNKDTKKKIKNASLESILELEDELSNYLEDPLVIVNVDEKFDRSSIGDIIVEGEDEEDPKELVIELNRRYKGKSVTTLNPEIQIHTHWEDLNSDRIPVDDIKKIYSRMSFNRSRCYYSKG